MYFRFRRDENTSDGQFTREGTFRTVFTAQQRRRGEQYLDVIEVFSISALRRDAPIIPYVGGWSFTPTGCAEEFVKGVCIYWQRNRNPVDAEPIVFNGQGERVRTFLRLVIVLHIKSRWFNRTVTRDGLRHQLCDGRRLVQVQRDQN